MAFVNPFMQLSADRYPVRTTLQYFEEAPFWAELHKPKNQVVFGHYGSGKSIALQRLRGSAMARKPRFATDMPFLGIYLNLLQVAFLDSVAKLGRDPTIRSRWPDVEDRALRIKEHYLALSLVQSAAAELDEIDKTPGFGQLSNVREVARQLATTVGYDPHKVSTFRALSEAAARDRFQIKKLAGSAAVFASVYAELEGTNLQLLGHQIAEIISAPRVFREFRDGVPTYFLIDQVEAVANETKQILNLLSRRENPFFTKTAARVHGHITTCQNSDPLKVGDDVFPVFAGFTLEETADFVRIATAVGDNMLRAHGDSRAMEDLLAGSRRHASRNSPGIETPIYAGAQGLATLASGSMRAFFEMCSLALRCASGSDINLARHPITVECQTQAAISMARQELERLSTSDSANGPKVRAIIEQIFRDVRRRRELMPSRVNLTGDLFPDDALGEDLKQVVRAGFELDAFRYLSIQDTTYGEIPEAFGITPVFAPAFGVSQRRGDPKNLTPDELKRMAATHRGRPVQQPESTTRPGLLYLTGYARQPVSQSHVEAVREVFGDEFSVIVNDKSAASQGLNRLVNTIRSADLVLVEVSVLNPDVMLTLGVSYALRKRTFVTLNLDLGDDFGDINSFVRTLDIVTYSSDIDRLKVARDKISQRFQTASNPSEMMEENAFGITLRPRSDPSSVFLYYPEGRAVWNRLRPQLREHLTRLGARLSTVEGAPYNSTALESVMFSINRASRDFRHSCVIDTTGRDSPDLIGCFAIGAGFALRRGVIRIEEAGRTNERGLGLWTGAYEPWAGESELHGILKKYVTPRARESRRPRGRK
jgi:hypothetical protein